MEQNLSLYEDALRFYLIIPTDSGELSETMQFAREVRTRLICVTVKVDHQILIWGLNKISLCIYCRNSKKILVRTI